MKLNLSPDVKALSLFVALFAAIITIGVFNAHPVHAQTACPTGTQVISTNSATTCGASSNQPYGLYARSVNFAATGDQATISIPSWVTKYQVTAVKITNCSTTPILAQPSVFTAPAGGGNNIVAAATITAATSTAVVINSALATTNTQTSSSLTVRLSVANALAITCDVLAQIQDMT